MAADFQDILKVVPYANLFWFGHNKGEVKEEFAVLATESGSLIYINPKRNIVHLFYRGTSDNAAFALTYSHISESVYTFSTPGILIEFDTKTFQTHFYPYYDEQMPSSNAFQQVVPMGPSTVLSTGIQKPHTVLVSEDGNIHFSTIRARGVPCLTIFDVITKQFSFSNQFSDQEYEHLWGKPHSGAWSIDSNAGTLAGTYSEYVYQEDRSSLHATIQSEISTAGLTTVTNKYTGILLHFDDRALASSTRRILAQINGTWRIIDLKNPSNFLNSQVSDIHTSGLAFSTNTWIDPSSTPVDGSGWISGLVKDFESLTVPADFVIWLTKTRKIGRFSYEWWNYNNNKVFFWHYAYHPITNEALYPDSFDKAITWQNNGSNPKVYKCNMPTAQGFSVNPELVVAVRNNAGQTGYYRADNYQYTLYDFVTDPSGYVIREVDVDSADDPDWIGVFHQSTTVDEEITFLGEEGWVRPPSTVPDWMKGAIKVEFQQSIDVNRPVANLTIEMTPDRNGSDVYINTINNIPTLTGIINSIVDVGSNRYIFPGNFYSGIVAGTLSGDFTQDAYFNDVISIKAHLRWGDKIIFHGYLDKINIIDTTSWPPTKTDVQMGSFVNDHRSAASRTNEVVLAGNQVREANYRNDYFRVGYTDGITAFGFPNLPNHINPQVGIDLRITTLNLPDEDYTDAQVEGAVKDYLTANPSETRVDLINDLLDSGKWRALWVDAYDDKVIFALQRRGIAALRGIRVNDQPDLLGTWYDENHQVSTDYPSAVYLDKADLSSLIEPDYKTVSFQVVGLQGVSHIGRVFASNNHLAWINNENDNGVIRVISKTNFETAANGSGIITTFDQVVTISLGVNFYLGNIQSFTKEDRYSNFAFTIADKLYITCLTSNQSGGNPIIGYEIDLATGAFTEFLTNGQSTDDETTITYELASNRLLVARGTQGWKVDNFTSQPFPILIN